jgi:major membrane immunogen (membrane-anchored lipoprotein)
MKKLLMLLVVLALVFTLAVGCSTPADEEEPEVTEENTEDAETTASLVSEEEAFVSALGSDGTWIICPLNDITTDQELVVEGEFYNKDDSSSDIYRKIGPYAQDADHNVTERYTVTAPKMTIKSPNTNFQGGTFVGDIYVEAEGFKLKDATIDGNLYFATEELKEGFVNEEGTIAGVTEIKSNVLADGTYKAEDPEFGDSGWKYIVTLEVEGGKIVDAEWNGVHKDGGDDKITQSINGEYGMVEKGNAASEWHEQSALAEAYLLDTQDPTEIEYTSEEGHTDAIAGASIHVKEFFDLAQKALASDPQ